MLPTGYKPLAIIIQINLLFSPDVIKANLLLVGGQQNTVLVILPHMGVSALSIWLLQGSIPSVELFGNLASLIGNALNILCFLELLKITILTPSKLGWVSSKIEMIVRSYLLTLYALAILPLLMIGLLCDPVQMDCLSSPLSTNC